MIKNAFKEHCFHLFILVLASSFFYMITFYPTFSFGYDFEFHYVMYEAFKDQINQGDLYPRWLDNINSGFGGINFFLYPPLYYYLQYLIDIVTLEKLETLTLIRIYIFLVILGSGLSFYFLGCKISSPKKSLLAAIFYASTFYQLWVTLSLRNGFSTACVSILLPITFYSAHNLHKNNKYFFIYVFSLSLVILSNIPTAIMVCSLLALYEIYILFQEKNIRKLASIAFRFSTASLLAAGISCFYLLPCINFLDFFNKDFLWIDYYKWFLVPFFDNDSFLPYVKLTLFYMGLWQLCVSTIAIALKLKHLDNDRKKLSIFLFTLMTLIFFMMTPLSLFLWQNINIMSVVQMPLRLFILNDFIFILLMLTIFSPSSDKQVFSGTPLKALFFSYLINTIILVHILFINAGYKLTSVEQIKAVSPYIPNMSTTSEYIIPNEHLEIFPPDFMNVKKPGFFINTNSAEARLTSDIPRKKDLYINAKEPSTISIRQFYFHAWSLTDTKSGQNYTSEYNLRDVAPYGNIAFDVPQGEHNLSLALNITLAEKIGRTVSILSLLLLVAYAIGNNIRTNRTRKSPA